MTSHPIGAVSGTAALDRAKLGSILCLQRALGLERLAIVLDGGAIRRAHRVASVVLSRNRATHRIGCAVTVLASTLLERPLVALWYIRGIDAGTNVVACVRISHGLLVLIDQLDTLLTRAADLRALVREAGLEALSLPRALWPLQANASAAVCIGLAGVTGAPAGIGKIVAWIVRGRLHALARSEIALIAIITSGVRHAVAVGLAVVHLALLAGAALYAIAHMHALAVDALVIRVAIVVGGALVFTVFAVGDGYANGAAVLNLANLAGSAGHAFAGIIVEAVLILAATADGDGQPEEKGK